MSGENVFFAATGLSNGALLRGVSFAAQRVVTRSLPMRSRTRAVRIIETHRDRARSNLIDLR